MTLTHLFNKRLKLKLLIAGSIPLFFLGCNSGSTGSNSTNYGQLSTYNYAANYTLDQITDSAYATLCYGLATNSPTCQSNLTNLQTNYGFDISSIDNNTLGVTGVVAYNITYNTPGYTTDGTFNYRNRIVSGAVYIPQGINANEIKGIILYYHPTAYNVNDFSPSQDALNGSKFPGMYASQGYIVVMPDLLGFGADNTEMHPYVYPKINVIAGINMLQAANQLFPLIDLNFTNSLPLIINGFSEGGMLTQWASYMIQNNEVSLAGTNTSLQLTVPLSGGFNLKDYQSPMEYANLTAPSNNIFLIESQEEAALAKPGLIAYATNSYNYYTNTACNTVLESNFCNFSLPGVQANSIADIFESVNQPSTADTQSILFTIAESMGYGVNANSINPITQPFPSQDFLQAYFAVGLTNWTTTSPITYVHLAKDSLLTPYNTISTYNNVSASSQSGLVNMMEINNESYLIGNPPAPIDHNNPVMYVVALSIFEQYFPN